MGKCYRERQIDKRPVRPNRDGEASAGRPSQQEFYFGGTPSGSIAVPNATGHNIPLARLLAVIGAAPTGTLTITVTPGGTLTISSGATSASGSASGEWMDGATMTCAISGTGGLGSDLCVAVGFAP